MCQGYDEPMESAQKIQTESGSRNIDLSVIIVTHNTRDLLRACLESIRAKTRQIRYEIIVVDNRSTDGTRDLLAQAFPDVRYLYRDEPSAFAAANNLGIGASRGRHVLLLNSDTVLENDALDRMVRFLDAHPECGIAGCQLLNSDGTLQLSCRRFPGYLTALFNRYSLLTRLFPDNTCSRAYLMSDADHNRTTYVDWVSGACLFARRTAIEDVGLLDERIALTTEDVDWCKRMWEAGWAVAYHPAARVIHHIGATMRQHPYRVIVLRHHSMYYYYRKHVSESVLVIDAAVFCGLVLRALVQCVRQATSDLFRQRQAS